MSEIEKRLRVLEKFKDHAEPVIAEVEKFLDISRPRVNPAKYCSDELDLRIIEYLLDAKGAGTSEIAKALGLDPKKGRHTIGKRIAKINRLSINDAWQILDFHAERRQGKFRAWFIDLTKIDHGAFRKSLQKQLKEQKPEVPSLKHLFKT